LCLSRVLRYLADVFTQDAMLICAMMLRACCCCRCCSLAVCHVMSSRALVKCYLSLTRASHPLLARDPGPTKPPRYNEPIMDSRGTDGYWRHL